MVSEGIDRLCSPPRRFFKRQYAERGSLIGRGGGSERPAREGEGRNSLAGRSGPILGHGVGTIATHPTFVEFGDLLRLSYPPLSQPRRKQMSDVAEKLVRWKLLRNTAMVAVVIPAALVAGCAQEQPAPPPQPAISEAPPPPQAPPPPPAPVIGERG